MKHPSIEPGVDEKPRRAVTVVGAVVREQINQDVEAFVHLAQNYALSKGRRGV